MRKWALEGGGPRVLALSLALVVFVTDLFTPLGVAHPILYIPAVLLTLWSDRERDPLLAGGLCTLLTLVAWTVEAPPASRPVWLPATNRGLSLLALWVTALGVRTRRRTDARLLERERALRAVLDTVNEAILTVRSSGEITTFNRAAERMFGRSAAEAVGEDVRALLASGEPEAAQRGAPIGELLERAEARAGGPDLRCRRRGGEPFPVELDSSEWDGRAGMHTLVLRDVTERRALEAEVAQSQRLEAVGRFAGAIAHDFNNLLMGILGCCRIAARATPEGGPARAQLDEIRSAAERGATLTRQLLAFSRRQDVESERVRLDELVRGNEALVRSLVGEDVQLELALDTPGRGVLAAPGQVEQVLLNLVSNARDAMPAGGRLTITTGLRECREEDPTVSDIGAGGPHVELAVADTGSGMDEATRARAFEPFFTTKPAREGTGLGLSTVYGIVRRLGGHVHLESAVGAGTTVRVHLLPAAEGEVAPEVVEPAPATAAPASPPAPLARGGETILVVEDDRLVRAGLRHLLEEEGYRVLLAAHGEEALRIAERHEEKIDLVVTDIIMPGMGGAELARRLVEPRPGLVVLFMSALPRDVLVEEGRLEEGRPTIQKPFDEAELTARVRELMAADSGRPPAG